jgi:hypothetical protein
MERQPVMRCMFCRGDFIPALTGPPPRYCSPRCRVYAWRRLRKLRRMCKPAVTLEEGIANLCARLRAGQGAADFPAAPENPEPAAVETV